MELYIDNFGSVQRLVEIHVKQTGSGPGRRINVDVLNKSAIVLLAACWEAFVEDLALAAFAILLDNSEDYSRLPGRVLTQVANRIKKDDHHHAVWRLAGDGWRAVLTDYRDAQLTQHVRKFNTPGTAQVDDLFSFLLGLEDLSTCWHWRGVSRGQAVRQLKEFIELRGEIAHRVATSRPVRKADVMSYVNLINRLVIATHQAVAAHLYALVKQRPWAGYFIPRAS